MNFFSTGNLNSTENLQIYFIKAFPLAGFLEDMW